jgi:hypothetical protein
VNEGKVIYCTGQGAGRVLLMLLDPDWLLETSQKADFSDGAEEWATFGTQGVEFVAHPEKPGAKVLSLRKTDPDWPAAAVWNFPSGRQGRLHLRLKLNPGFAGALVGLTDHFSVPFDLEDRFNNLFNLDLGVRSGPVRASAVRSEPVRTSASRRNYEQGARLTPGRWHDLLLEWDCAGRECRVLVDGRSTGVLPLLRETAGVCYLRLRSTAEQTDNAGFLVESVEADISNN